MYKKLLNVMQEKKVNKSQLAMRCMISPSDLYSALGGKKPLYPKWRKAIAEYLQASESELFEEEE